MRIEAIRRLFPKVWFNASTTEAGRDALGYYHERRTKRATSASVLNMTGVHTPLMLSV
jgi:hypothetical protein